MGGLAGVAPGRRLKDLSLGRGVCVRGRSGVP